MITKGADAKGKLLVEGVVKKNLVYGDKTLMCEFELKKGSKVPPHKHPHEQTGYLIKGRMLFIIEGEKYELKARDSWCIKGNVEHAAEALEDSLAVEVFSPLREDYLE